MTSPCVRRCQLSAKVCIGCGRTLQEITIWSGLSESDRQVVLAELPFRRAALAATSALRG